MTRLEMFLLVLLAAIGWGCAFALVGLVLFKGLPGAFPQTFVFAAFGMAAGGLLAGLRLVWEQQLPRSLTLGLRCTARPAGPPSAALPSALAGGGATP